jgi:tRNA (cytidine/uridine-2'-O-)-methyltransferase
VVDVLLHAPLDFSNLCVIARTLEVFGLDRCTVFDPHHLVRPQYGKSYRQRLRTVSAGAFERISFEVVDDVLGWLAARPGRTIATTPRAPSTSLCDFCFRSDDTLVFGSEDQGLPDDVLAATTERVHIPQRGITESLNLAVAASIVLFECHRQLAGPPR